MHYIIRIALCGTATKTSRKYKQFMNLLPLNNKKLIEILSFDLANTVAVQFHNSASHPILVGDDNF
jgi:hypothetical protein